MCWPTTEYHRLAPPPVGRIEQSVTLGGRADFERFSKVSQGSDSLANRGPSPGLQSWVSEANQQTFIAVAMNPPRLAGRSPQPKLSLFRYRLHPHAASIKPPQRLYFLCGKLAELAGFHIQRKRAIA